MIGHISHPAPAPCAPILEIYLFNKNITYKKKMLDNNILAHYGKVEYWEERYARYFNK